MTTYSIFAGIDHLFFGRISNGLTCQSGLNLTARLGVHLGLRHGGTSGLPIGKNADDSPENDQCEYRDRSDDALHFEQFWPHLAIFVRIEVIHRSQIQPWQSKEWTDPIRSEQSVPPPEKQPKRNQQ